MTSSPEPIPQATRAECRAAVAELNDIAELSQEVGIMLNPVAQFFTALIGLHAIKILGFVRWNRAGRPESEKGEKGGAAA